MDALLLTQGWSNYKYQKSEPIVYFKFLPQNGLTVSWNVKNFINDSEKEESITEL